MILKSLSKEFCDAFLKELAHLGLGVEEGKTKLFALKIIEVGEFQVPKLTDFAEGKSHEATQAHVKEVGRKFDLIQTTSKMMKSVYPEVITFPLMVAGGRSQSDKDFIKDADSAHEHQQTSQVYSFNPPDREEKLIQESDAPLTTADIVTLRPKTT